MLWNRIKLDEINFVPVCRTHWTRMNDSRCSHGFSTYCITMYMHVPLYLLPIIITTAALSAAIISRCNLCTKSKLNIIIILIKLTAIFTYFNYIKTHAVYCGIVSIANAYLRARCAWSVTNHHQRYNDKTKCPFNTITQC